MKNPPVYFCLTVQRYQKAVPVLQVLPKEPGKVFPTIPYVSFLQEIKLQKEILKEKQRLPVLQGIFRTETRYHACTREPGTAVL